MKGIQKDGMDYVDINDSDLGLDKHLLTRQNLVLREMPGFIARIKKQEPLELRLTNAKIMKHAETKSFPEETVTYPVYVIEANLEDGNGLHGKLTGVIKPALLPFADSAAVLLAIRNNLLFHFRYGRNLLPGEKTKSADGMKYVEGRAYIMPDEYTLNGYGNNVHFPVPLTGLGPWFEAEPSVLANKMIRFSTESYSTQ